MVLVALLDTTPAQVASMVTAWPVWNLWEDREVFGRVREALLAHDRRWAAQLVEAILREPDVGVYTRLAHPLIVAHDLPLPGQPAFWQLWAHELSLPQPNQRWEEHFLAACAVPDHPASSHHRSRLDRGSFLRKVRCDILFVVA